MGKNRIQLSLLCDDTEVYENLILPLKQGKCLADLIVKLLSVYYYDEGVQQRVDQNIESEDTSAEDRRQAMYQDINETLSMIEFLADEGRATLDDSADTISEILAGAQEAGVAETVDTGYGNSMIKFNFDKSRLSLPNKEEAEPINTPVKNTDNNDLEKRMEAMESTLQSIQTLLSQLSVNGNVTKNAEVNSPEVVVEEYIEDAIGDSDASSDMDKLLGSL